MSAATSRSEPAARIRRETLLMLAISAAALGVVAAIVTWTASACHAQPPLLLETLPSLRASAAAGAVTQLNVDGAALKLPRTTVRAVSPARVEIRGWAYDPLAGQNGSDVFAMTESGRTFRASYQGDRDPRDAPRGSPSNSGFHVVVPTAGLAQGPQRVKLLVVAADRSGYYDFGVPIVLDVQ